MCIHVLYLHAVNINTLSMSIQCSFIYLYPHFMPSSIIVTMYRPATDFTLAHVILKITSWGQFYHLLQIGKLSLWEWLWLRKYYKGLFDSTAHSLFDSVYPACTYQALHCSSLDSCLSGALRPAGGPHQCQKSLLSPPPKLVDCGPCVFDLSQQPLLKRLVCK